MKSATRTKDYIMAKMIWTCILLAACSARKAPPMSGTCVDRVSPNFFDQDAPDVEFKVCQWQDRIWVCRLEEEADAWRCVALTPVVPAVPVAPNPTDPTL